MKTMLEEFRSKKYKEFDKELNDFPPVSSRLIVEIERFFTPVDLNPGDPTLSQQLILQHGINKVLRFLRDINARQEKGLQARLLKE